MSYHFDDKNVLTSSLLFLGKVTGAEIAIKEIDFLGLEYRPRVYSSPSCMSKREIIGRVFESIILHDHVGRGKEMKVIVTDSDSIDFQRSDNKHSSKLSLSSR